MTDFNLGLFIKNTARLQIDTIATANLAGVGKTTLFAIEKNNESVSWSNLLAMLKVLNIRVEFMSPLRK
jgi:DNA-binding XRE family transcriptional regulator